MNVSKILVVEDEVITAMEIQNKLQEFGYDVPTIASSGEEAISVADKSQPNLILMDIKLSGKCDGIEAAKHISHANHIPIVFLTAFGDVKTFSRAKEASPYGYILKPFETNELRITVDLALFKHQMELATHNEIYKLKNEFLSNMSHELRTPLNSIFAFIQMLYTNNIDLMQIETKKMLESVLMESRRLMHLVENVLKLTELESGVITLKPVTIHLENLIYDIANLFPYREKGITLSVEVDHEIDNIAFDPSTLKDILYYYFSNAVKFSPENSLITVRARLDEGGQWFRIEVCDQGAGIREEDFNKLFLPFHQLDMSVNKCYQGAGLGLALTSRIVEMVGGKVGVTSTLGKGSVFFAVLPRHLSAKN